MKSEFLEIGNIDVMAGDRSNSQTRFGEATASSACTNWVSGSFRRIARHAGEIALCVFAMTSGAAAQTNFGTQKLHTVTTLPVSVTLTSGGSVSSVEVLTLGAPKEDFSDAGGSCSGSFSAGQTCTEAISFTPIVPGSRPGAVVLLDGSGSVLGTTLLSGTGQGGVAVFLPGNEATIAGNGGWTSVQDGSPAINAQLNLPSSVVLDGGGNLYIADSQHNRIRMVSSGNGATIQNSSAYPQAGYITTVAGNGSAGWSGDGTPAVSSSVTLNKPSGIAIDGAGNLFIADTGNHVIRRVDAATGIISTIAGNGSSGSSGDNGPALLASLNGPWGVTVDLAGNIFVADTGNHKIRAVCASADTVLFGISCAAQGNIVTVAGNGYTTSTGTGGFSGDSGPATSAELNSPYAVAFDASGAMYIPDSGNNRIRKVNASGTISTFAGNGTSGSYGDGGLATAAQLQAPSGVAIDAAQNVLICDSGNSGIRKVNARSKKISTIAKGGVGEYISGQKIAATSLYGPKGIALDGVGNVYIADFYNMRIHEIKSNAAFLDFSATSTPDGTTSSSKNQIIENDGNDQLVLGSTSVDSNSAIDSSTTTCASSSPLSSASQCTIAAEFAPSVIGNPVIANIAMDGQGTNWPLTLILAGNATAANSTATTTSLLISPSPAVAGSPLTLVATVTAASNGLAISGSVSFTDGAVTLGSAQIGAGGTAALMVTLAPGTHNIVAAYAGNSTTNSSASAAAALTVNQAVTQVSLTSSATSAQVLAPVTLNAIVTGNGGIPTGAIAFSMDGAVAGTATLDANGMAMWVSSNLSIGTHVITAKYSGDANSAASTSKAISQTVIAIPSDTILNTASNASSGSGPVLVANVVVTSGPTPTGTVTFTNGATVLGAVALDSSSTATFTPSLAGGSYKIVATYGGDSYHAASSSTSLSVTTTQSNFTVAVNPTAVNVSSGGVATVKISLSSPGPLSDTLQMGCLGLPAGVTCHFSSDTVSVKAGATASVEVVIDTNLLNNSQTASRTESGKGSVSLASLFWPGCLLLSVPLWRFRKRCSALLVLSSLLIALCAVAGLSGCGGMVVMKAKPGTYAIQIGGTGMNTRTSAFQDVSLTITK